MSVKVVNRRMFLTGMGQIAMAIPVLPSLLPRVARAQAQVVPPRFVAMSSEDGAIPSGDWFPSVLPTTNKTAYYPATLHPNTAFKYYNAPAHYIHSGPINYTNAGISTFFDSKFNSLVPKMNFIKGLDWRYTPSGNHNGAPLLGNILNSTGNFIGICDAFPTIDQIMAYSNNFYPNNGVGYVRSINVCPSRTSGDFSFGFQNPILRTGPIVRTPAVNDPKVLFTQLFGNVSADPASPSSTPYVDAVLANFKKVRDGRAISSEDKQLLQAHIDLFADLEKNLKTIPAAPTLASCAAPTAPASRAYIELSQSDAVIKASYQAMNSMIVLALACQRTRVATSYVHTVPGFEGLGGSAFESSKWHWASHAVTSADPVEKAQGLAYLQEIYKWISNNVLYDLVSKMEAVTEANGKTLLDNSIVQYSSSSMDVAHAHRNMPMLLFGSAGGKLKTGQYIDYQSRDAVVQGKPGILFNRYLVTAMQAMGLAADDYSMTKLGLLYGKYPEGAPGYGEYKQQPDWAYGPQDVAVYMGSVQSIGSPLPFLIG